VENLRKLTLNTTENFYKIYKTSIYVFSFLNLQVYSLVFICDDDEDIGDDVRNSAVWKRTLSL